jgi:hypothetical protein
MHNIEPGDRYRGEVQLMSGRFLVMKYHVDPSCPVDPFEEEMKILEELRRESESESKKEKRAA